MVRDAIEIILHFVISQGAVRGLIHDCFQGFTLKAEDKVQLSSTNFSACECYHHKHKDERIRSTQSFKNLS